MAETPDVRWPREWEATEDPCDGLWLVDSLFLGPDVPARIVEVVVPADGDGRPDVDGLIARLRLDPVEVERDRQRLTEALAQVERLKATLRAINGAALAERGGEGVRTCGSCVHWEDNFCNAPTPAWVERFFAIEVVGGIRADDDMAKECEMYQERLAERGGEG